jgi:hypothetical protein
MAEQDNTPEHSQGFGPAENADETRQAQHQAANDTPTDVNPNASLARMQTAMYAAQQETVTLMGKNFESSAARRNAMFDQMAAKEVKPSQ